ncbi:alpha/beta hydrolase [Arthrobacter sp. MMS24-T111]
MTSGPDHSPFSSAFSGEGPRTGIVLSHGFTGSPHGLRAWATAFAAAGFAVRMPLLPGHGTTWQDLSRTRWQQWHGALDEAFLELDAQCDRVFAAGLSMGGALALRIAATRPVAGVVLVNPGLVVDDPRAPLAGILKLVLKSTPSIGNDILKAGVDEGAYARTPVAAAHELNKMFKDTVRLLPGSPPRSRCTGQPWTMWCPMPAWPSSGVGWRTRPWTWSGWKTVTTSPPWTTTPSSSSRARWTSFGGS